MNGRNLRSSNANFRGERNKCQARKRVPKVRSREAVHSCTKYSCQPSILVHEMVSTNLLDYASILQACQTSAYSIIVDKSTSASIACSDDLYVPLSYHNVAASHQRTETTVTELPKPCHTLHIVAVHLALFTKPGCRWISLYHSTDRYSFPQLPTPESEYCLSQSIVAITELYRWI